MTAYTDILQRQALLQSVYSLICHHQYNRHEQFDMGGGVTLLMTPNETSLNAVLLYRGVRYGEPISISYDGRVLRLSGSPHILSTTMTLPPATEVDESCCMTVATHVSDLLYTRASQSKAALLKDLGCMERLGFTLIRDGESLVFCLSCQEWRICIHQLTELERVSAAFKSICIVLQQGALPNAGRVNVLGRMYVQVFDWHDQLIGEAYIEADTVKEAFMRLVNETSTVAPSIDSLRLHTEIPAGIIDKLIMEE